MPSVPLPDLQRGDIKGEDIMVPPPLASFWSCAALNSLFQHWGASGRCHLHPAYVTRSHMAQCYCMCAGKSQLPYCLYHHGWGFPFLLKVINLRLYRFISKCYLAFIIK
uniref:Uncharacterized protein n=1 Tax=Pyxicephalus adspersus TaxID=30357 RepID=A0AAV3A455_PYXAD|nr:TPA: hypothetical protein GDO54_012967 [Pyxicephalus adspersus]